MANPKPSTGVNTDYPTALGAAIDALNRRLKGNLIDNGAFQVWQRGTSVAGAAGRTYTADRWVLYRTGFVTGATVSQQPGSQAQWCARVQRDNGNANTGTITFVQQVESVNVIPLRGKTVTVAYRARCSAGFTAAGSLISIAVNTGTGTDEANDFRIHRPCGKRHGEDSDHVISGFHGDVTVPANASEFAVPFAFSPGRH
jgi:hypothetical protein